MLTAQHAQQGTVFLHPTICTRPELIDAFQRRTGLQLIVSASGLVRAVQTGGVA